MNKSAKDQWEAIKNDLKKQFPQSTSASILKAQYKPDWIERVDFELCNAAKYMENMLLLMERTLLIFIPITK